MILNTSRLFRRLLRTLDIETVCDIGSMDGSDALRFRQMLPNAKIIALEPNPINFALMEADQQLAEKSITIFPVAASDRTSDEPFYVVDADYEKGHDQYRRGMSSLHRPSDGSQLADVVQVCTTRLDQLLAAESLDEKPIALWIDAEGKALEVITGAEAILSSTPMLHVEVETEPIIGAEQKLFQHLEGMLGDAGFTLIATDQPIHHLQFNALFVRADALGPKAAPIRYWMIVMRLLRVLAQTASRFLPDKLLRKLVALTH
ncbi:MAG: FkbM family methyltransferase [Woeseiaceae bacterium]